MTVWLFEWDPAEVELDSSTVEELRSEGRVLAQDIDWILLDTDYETVRRIGKEMPDGIPGVPASGAWVDEGGDIVYIDDRGRLVDSAAAVVETIEEIADRIAFIADDEEREYQAQSLLGETDRVF